MRLAFALILACLALDSSAKSPREDYLRPALEGPRPLGCYYADELYEEKIYPYDSWKLATRYMVRQTTAMSSETIAELSHFISGRRTTQVACLEGFYDAWRDELFVMSAVLKREAEVTAADVEGNQWVCRQPPFVIFRPRFCRRPAR